MSSVSYQITIALAERVARCTKQGGCLSNVGASVFVGRNELDFTQAPASYILPGNHVPDTSAYGDTQVRRRFTIRGIVPQSEQLELNDIADLALVDSVIWDLRRIIETPEDDTLASLIEKLAFIEDKPAYRTPGGTVVGAILTYEITYSVSITDPSTAT
jgi:hypothetical protein